MSDVAALSDEYWATSKGVRDKIDVPTHGDPTPVKKSIDSATDSVQTWWQDATGKDYPDDLPNPATLEEKNALLVRATEYLAASEEHEKQTEQVQAAGEQKGGTEQPKWVFLENRAHTKFDDWVIRHGFDDAGGAGGGNGSGGGGGGNGVVRGGGSGSGSGGTGRASSLVDLPNTGPGGVR